MSISDADFNHRFHQIQCREIKSEVKSTANPQQNPHMARFAADFLILCGRTLIVNQTPYYGHLPFSRLLLQSKYKIH